MFLIDADVPDGRCCSCLAARRFTGPFLATAFSVGSACCSCLMLLFLTEDVVPDLTFRRRVPDKTCKRRQAEQGGDWSQDLCVLGSPFTVSFSLHSFPFSAFRPVR